jgi:hypothetical protein
MRKCGFDNIDKALLECFKVQRDAGFPINGPILKIQAEKFAMQLEHKDYSCSNGWLDRFKKQHTQCNLCSSQWRGPISRHKNGKCEWVKSFWEECKKEYSEEEICIADETGLFYYMPPDTMFKFKGEKCVSGRKLKKRLIVLICVNMSGMDKKKTFCNWTISKASMFQKYKQASC